LVSIASVLYVFPPSILSMFILKELVGGIVVFGFLNPLTKIANSKAPAPHDPPHHSVNYTV
jgi:hypothetical protein